LLRSTAPKHLSDLCRCSAANVVTTALEFGNRLLFELFQGFLSRSHDAENREALCGRCAGNHKGPIFDNMRAGFSDCRKSLRGGRPVTDRALAYLGGKRDAAATSAVYIYSTRPHQTDCLRAVRRKSPCRLAFSAPRRFKGRDAHF
jgi:hypothetical protein